MTTLEMFRAIRRGGYNHNRFGVDWKVEEKILLFEETDDKIDWLYNFLSVFRIPGRLGGTWFIFPLGAWIIWKSIKGTVKRLAKEGKIIAVAGFSLGGWPAAYSSAETGLPGFTFGCPRLGLGEPYIFGKVVHRKTPGDIVANLPPWGKTYGQVMILNKPYTPKKNLDILEYVEMVTGHSPDEYEARLQ